MTRWVAGFWFALVAIAMASVAVGDSGSVKLDQRVFESRAQAISLGESSRSAYLIGTYKDDTVTWPKFDPGSALLGKVYVRSAVRGTPATYMSVALVRSGAAVYDTLYIDVNMDKSFSDSERWTAKGKDDKGEIAFGVASLPVTAGDAPLVQMLISAAPTTNTRLPGMYLYYCPATYLVGEAKIGAQTQSVRLIDVNMDGAFDGFNIDMISIGDENPRKLSRVIMVGDALWSMTVNGSVLATTPFDGATGRIAVDVNGESGSLVCASGSLVATTGTTLPIVMRPGAPVTVPVGDYTVSPLSVECRDGDKVWTASVTGRTVSVTGGESVLALGKPIRLDATLTGSTEAGKAASIGYSLKGQANEVYASIAAKDASGNAVELPKPTAMVRDASGTQLAELTMEPG